MDNEAKRFVVRGYGRASTDHQVMSTEVQESVANDAFNLFKRCHQEWANAEWGGFFSDDDTCRLTKFREREYGSRILALSRPGDAIICTAADRIFGDLLDLCETLDMLHKAGIKLRVLDRNIDTSDDIGQGVFKILAVVAEMEVKRLRKRTKESIAYRKRIGRCHNKPAIGWKHVVVRVPGVTNPQRYAVHDNPARRLARELLALKRQYKRGYEQMAQFCNTVLDIKQRNGKRWTPGTFKKWCEAAADGFPMSNGQLEAAPIPAGALPVEISTISPDD